VHYSTTETKITIAETAIRAVDPTKTVESHFS